VGHLLKKNKQDQRANGLPEIWERPLYGYTNPLTPGSCVGKIVGNSTKLRPRGP
jgi:hypothetical protein